MPIDYWIAKVKILSSRSDNHTSGSVHHRVHARTCLDGRLRDLQLAINVLSRSNSGEAGSSHLKFVVVSPFEHPITMDLPAYFASQAPEFQGKNRAERHYLENHAFAVRPGPQDLQVRLDYLRSGLFDPGTMQVLPPSGPGVKDDLQDHLRSLLQLARQHRDCWVYVFGELWTPGANLQRRPSSLSLQKAGSFAYGIHDIHMNQGNEPRFQQADGVFQDGGLLFHFGHLGTWVGVFLAFQGQAWETDPVTGHRLF
ncbi:DUF2278 family protein [Deinococcus cellulosilyticus]|uniref:DUF2278 family protein n=1 Tax=Deinococcus cellulosilyticus (strain DSM 18568 / NBRC 106333 / KACC 11606 / 5516J-15) TaxID=1223518 RepID=A0A511N778_DEIC1|nr:DUF2278 family protein [Deinococcus cellulosilyticus]GEM48316.1 hypothetical protein DC3_39510 [Deinococcus cellulosilyticus NBRC 106333 = KACC 11606]